ncbi:MAG: tRNA pseudouridine(55) synthase TruB [Bdellovibrionales bacterium]
MKKDSFHGVLLIRKEKDWTSHDVVQKIRNLLNQKSVGHAGTLDPMAEGLLVVLLGSVTKLSSYLLNADKRYKLLMKFGLITDSYDATGEILQDEKVSLKKDTIEKEIKKNLGELHLKVPYFSAVKVKGKKLYKYAQSGSEVERPIKKMSLYDLDIHRITKDHAEVSVSCSKGTYIRSWVSFLGEQLKTGACLMKLERVSSGFFSIDKGLTLLDLEKKLKNVENSKDLKTAIGGCFCFASEALPHFPFLELTNRDTKALSQGQIPENLIQKSQSQQIEVNQQGSSQFLKIVQGHHLITLLELEPYKKIKIVKNFPLAY